MGRSKKLELLDTGDYSDEEYREVLAILEKIGSLPGADEATISAIGPAKRILDLGCGGGHFAYKLATRYPSAEVVGYDIDDEAIAYAKERFRRDNLAFVREDPGVNFDVVTTNLVMHHLSDRQIVEILQKYPKVVINDLHRSWIAYLLYWASAPWLYKNRVIVHDGLISIRRSFKRRDWKRYLKLAGKKGSVRWKWAFRYLVAT